MLLWRRGAPLPPDACMMLVFVFRMFSVLMQCLLSWRFERLTTVSPASAFAEERGLYLLNKRDPKRFDSDGRGASSSSTVPLRFRSHETLAASRIALISFFIRLFMADEMFKSVMAGMILLSPPVPRQVLSMTECFVPHVADQQGSDLLIHLSS